MAASSSTFSSRCCLLASRFVCCICFVVVLAAAQVLGVLRRSFGSPSRPWRLVVVAEACVGQYPTQAPLHRFCSVRTVQAGSIPRDLSRAQLLAF